MHQSCPYLAQPQAAWWTNVGAKGDPTQKALFEIARDMKVASAGSCFAQHIRNHLINCGFTYMITEEGDQERNFGVFPARFGNVYTTMQLLQLFDRAYGRFSPAEDHWIEGGAYYDPFRPHVEPGGFISLDALRVDREAHLRAVRQMFEKVEVFIFTLGLTEAWRSREDGAVFQVCPGASVGEFDPERHEFVNFTAQETTDALFLFVKALKQINPSVKLILTVSPVPLTATMTGNNVIQATVYSKSVLRIAAEAARTAFGDVDYFPSYELVSGRSEEFFKSDFKTIAPRGVERVMDHFLECYSPVKTSQGSRMILDDVICDEEQALGALAEARA